MRGNPHNPDHDRHGYRNPRVPDIADIITLGDSQTYGTGVKREHAWPHQMAALTGMTVYNMALASYSPAHSLLQLEEALELSPDLVIVALYFGNDFCESFWLAQTNQRIASFIPHYLVPASQELEEKDPLINTFYTMFARSHQVDEDEVTASGPRAWFSHHSKLYGLLRGVRHLFEVKQEPTILANDFDSAVSALSESDMKYCSVLAEKDRRTILTAPYRKQVMDDSDVRIRAGFEISLQALKLIRDRLNDSGVHLLVVYIPTKESVFGPGITTPEEHVGITELLAVEKRLKDEFESSLMNAGITSFDVLPALQAATLQPYFENADGHPNETGHQIIARAVVARLQDKPF
jgi:hypothetical protein